MIKGSWKASRDGRISENAYVECSDILTLDADGRVFRQFDTTKIIERPDKAKEHYRIVVTLVGTYTLDGDIIKFVNMNPRYESSEYFATTEGCAPDVVFTLHTSKVKEANAKVLDGLVAEVMMNKAAECQQGNSDQIPPCHIQIEGNQLKMKWDGYDGVDVLEACDEPKNLDRISEPTPVEEALRAVDRRFFRAVSEGDCEFLNNATLYMPCEIEREGNQMSIKFVPLETAGMKLIVIYTDKQTMGMSELKQARMRAKLVSLKELNQYMGLFDGLCINPVQGKSLCLKANMVDAMVNGKWGGINNGKIIIND